MSAEEDARATTERELQPRRWVWTTRLSRLGTVAAVVLGVATGLGVSGSAWDSVLLSWLSGLPFSLPLAWHEALSPSAQGGPAATWSWVHLALGACTIASWTTFGVLVDLLRARRRNAPPPSLGQATSDDRYLAAAQADVEAMLRGEDRELERTPVRRKAVGRVDVATPYTAALPLRQLLLRFAFAALILVTAARVILSADNRPMAVLTFVAYLVAGYFLRPQPVHSNTGFLGFLDHPLRWTDDLNRFLVLLRIVLLPGRIAAAAIRDLVAIAFGRRRLRPPTSVPGIGTGEV